MVAILHHIMQLIVSTIEATSQAIWSKEEFKTIFERKLLNTIYMSKSPNISWVC